nr:hypothetical protein HmN_000476700 [Hymenolepis microstoma]
MRVLQQTDVDVNRPNFDILNILYKTMVLGDFSAYSTRWGYKNRNTARKEIEHILNSSPLELIYSNEDPATHLHYNGTRITLDFLLVSSHISELTQRVIIDDPGSGHKLVIASITINFKSMTPKVPTKKETKIQGNPADTVQQNTGDHSRTYPMEGCHSNSNTKKGKDPSNFDNHRPISLTSMLAKLM